MAKTLGNTTLFFNKGGALYLLCFFFLLSIGKAQQIAFDKQVNSDSFGQISVKGLYPSFLDQLKKIELTDKEWTSFFKTVVKGSNRPMLGTYSIGEDEIRFKPRFLPDPEVSYVVTFTPKSLKELIPDYPISDELNEVTRFEALSGDFNLVIGIFPESSEIPSNVLRFYIHFSEPSDFQNPFDHISIENDQGDIIAEPFVEIEEGLWSLDRRRLTVLIHPGRIKRNVGPNMTIGEVFEEGKSYRLIISDKWNLKEKFVKNFSITNALRTRIDLEKWEVVSPRIGGKDQLVIKTDRLLDHALSERLITILDSNGNPFEGEFNYNSITSKLTFTPDRPWSNSYYIIDVNPKLEDVCGNTLLSVFDVEGQGSKVKLKKFQLSFIVKK